MEPEPADLREIRLKAGLSLEQVAEALGLPAAAYAAYEAQQTKLAALPGALLSRLVPILRAHGLTLAELGASANAAQVSGRAGSEAFPPAPAGRSQPEAAPASAAKILSFQGARARQADPGRQILRARLAADSPDIVAAFCDRVAAPLPPAGVAQAIEAALADTFAAAPNAPSENAAATLFRAKLIARLHGLWSRLQFDLPQYVSDRSRIAAWQSRLRERIAHCPGAPGPADDPRVPVFQAEPIDDNGFEILLGASIAWRASGPHLLPATSYGVVLPEGFAAIRGLPRAPLFARAELPRDWPVPTGGAPILLSLLCAGDATRITTWLGHLEELSRDEALVRQPEPGGALHTVERDCVAIHPLVDQIDA